jgi:2-hydroxychromene-2-carboxylate isomerase
LTRTAPQFLFDFGSPNAYLSHLAIPAIEQRIGVKFEYVPILLGGIFKSTNNKSPAETLAGVKNKREFQAVETERFLKRFKVEPYVWNPHFPVNTLNLMRTAIAAQAEGVFEQYVDAQKLFARAQEPEVKGKLIKNTEEAVARGAFGSPTFFVGNEMFFGKEQLREVEEMVLGA